MKVSPLDRSSTPDANADSLKFTANTVLGNLVGAVRRLLSDLPGYPMTPAQLARQMNVANKVAWQFHRVAGCEDVLAAINFVPGPKPMRALLKSAATLGAANEKVRAASKAFDDFEHFVLHAAGDRATLITMLGDAVRDPSANADSDRLHRAAVFKSYSHFYRMSVELSGDLEIASETVPGQRVEVIMRTIKGLRRLRQDAQPLSEGYRRFEVKDPTKVLTLQPLDVEAFREHGVPIIPNFCSRPLPQMVTRFGTDPNEYRVEWANGTVGVKDAVDVTTGTVQRRTIPVAVDGLEHGVEFFAGVEFPSRILRKTWLYHLPGKKLLPPTVKTYLDPKAIISDEERSFLKAVELSEKLQSYPPGSWTALPDRFGSIREQVAYVCALMQWNPADFHIYELEIEFPLMHSVIAVKLPWIQT